jgi:hypothetical protein
MEAGTRLKLLCETENRRSWPHRLKFPDGCEFHKLPPASDVAGATGAHKEVRRGARPACRFRGCSFVLCPELETEIKE